MNAIKPRKETYERPETESICIAPLESIVQIISNPGGNVPPIEEE